MGSPTAAEVKVATGALEKDAGTWDDLAPDLLSCQSTMAGMTMSRLELGIFQIVATSYEELRSSMESRAGEGAAEFNGIADTLRQVSQTYQHEDDDQTHAYQNLW